MHKDYFPCHKCGKPTHIDDLDSKPEPHNEPDPEGKTNWTRLECGACYGPGYVSNRQPLLEHRTMPLEHRKFITRQMLRDEPETLFVFGDNMLELGLGGQAKEMRGEPNAIGIPTKYKPSMNPNAFFDDSDACYELASRWIKFRFSVLANYLRRGGKVVFPEDGIGTGLADLENKAPRIWALIQEQYRELKKI